MIGIYKIENKLNKKSYIGQSIHCGKRLDEHSKGSQLIDKVIQLEGIENFNFEILKEVKKEELNYWEDYYIIKFRTMFPNGYNKKWNCNRETREEIGKEILKERKENKVEEKIRIGDLIIEDKDFSLQTEKNLRNQNQNFALPEDAKIFKTMNDILYSYLYSISKYDLNEFENYNYIYLDKGPSGEKKYSHKDTYTKLGLSKSTYYRKLNILKDLGLIMETEHKGRRIFKIPFIESNRILNVKTCGYLSTAYKGLGFPPEDIIKTLCLLKEYYFNSKSFTIYSIKANLGYSLTNTDKDDYVHLILGILKGLDLIDYTGHIVKDGEVEKVIYTLTKADDAFNQQLETIVADKTSIAAITEDEEKRVYKFN